MALCGMRYPGVFSSQRNSAGMAFHPGSQSRRLGQALVARVNEFLFFHLFSYMRRIFPFFQHR